MTDGENEAVSIWPDRIGRIEAQKLLPQTVNDRSHPHRCSGMPGVRPLHGIHGKRADGIDRQLIDLLAGELNRYRVGRHSSPNKCSHPANRAIMNVLCALSSLSRTYFLVGLARRSRRQTVNRGWM